MLVILIIFAFLSLDNFYENLKNFTARKLFFDIIFLIDFSSSNKFGIFILWIFFLLFNATLNCVIENLKYGKCIVPS